MDSKTEPASEAKERIAELELENERLKQAYKYIHASRNSVDEELNEANKEITRLKAELEAYRVTLNLCKEGNNVQYDVNKKILAELERERSKNSWNDALDEVQKLFKDYLLPITPSSDNIALIAEKVVEIYKEIETLKAKN